MPYVPDSNRQLAERVSAREGYDRWAEVYDGEGNPLIALEEPRCAELLGDVAGLDVIDIGCGTGRHAVRLARAGARVTAVDFASGMVDQARHKPGWDAVRFVHHDLARPLPLPDSSFDRVLCALVLDHIQDLDGLFREFARLCRSGGAVVISSMHPAMMLRGLQAHFTDPTTGRDVWPESTPNEMSDYVMAAVHAGLHIEHMREYAVDEQLAASNARAAKYRGWPMLLMMKLRPSRSRA
jgi:malonyl-CoA O-methyltransferase